MRRNLFLILLIMGVLTALERNSLCFVAPGRFGCPTESPEQSAQDYGLFYHTGYAIAYVFDCVFLAIWMPFFNWWVKDLPVPKSALEGINGVLMAVNRVLFGAHLLYQGIHFFCILYVLFVFRENMKSFSLRSAGQRTSWKERFFLVTSAVAAVMIGSAALHTLDAVEMVKVKTVEYGLVLVPAQILIGLRLASKVQRKREQRVLAGLAASRHVEMGVQDEKVGA
jgi:hypothetical protein